MFVVEEFYPVLHILNSHLRMFNWLRTLQFHNFDTPRLEGPQKPWAHLTKNSEVGNLVNKKNTSLYLIFRLNNILEYNVMNASGDFSQLHFLKFNLLQKLIFTYFFQNSIQTSSPTPNCHVDSDLKSEVSPSETIGIKAAEVFNIATDGQKEDGLGSFSPDIVSETHEERRVVSEKL